MTEVLPSAPGVSFLTLTLSCLLAWLSGALFGWSIREARTWLPNFGRRRRRKRSGYYFSEEKEYSRGGRWRTPVAWVSAVIIVAALGLSAVVTVASKQPPVSGSVRRHR